MTSANFFVKMEGIIQDCSGISLKMDEIWTKMADITDTSVSNEGNGKRIDDLMRIALKGVQLGTAVDSKVESCMLVLQGMKHYVEAMNSRETDLLSTRSALWEEIRALKRSLEESQDENGRLRAQNLLLQSENTDPIEGRHHEFDQVSVGNHERSSQINQVSIEENENLRREQEHVADVLQDKAPCAYFFGLDESSDGSSENVNNDVLFNDDIVQSSPVDSERARTVLKEKGNKNVWERVVSPARAVIKAGRRSLSRGRKTAADRTLTN